MTNKHFDYSIYGFCVDDETLADLSKSVKWLRDNRSRLHAADCTVHEPSARCSCGLHYVLSTLGFVGNDIETALAASAQVREVEPWGYEFDDAAGAHHVVQGPLPSYAQRNIKPAAEPAPCTAADDTPSKSRANRIRLEKGESVAVAQGVSMPAWFMVETPGADVDLTFVRSEAEARDLLHDDDDQVPLALYTAEQMQATIADHARIVADMQYRIDTANAFGEQCMADIDRLLKEAEQTEASLAAYRADAERYRLLRVMLGTVGRRRSIDFGGCTPEKLDAALDTALADAARSQS